MALKDFLALADKKLAEIFNTVEYDPTKDRAKLSKRIDTTKEKFLATEPARGRKDYRAANNVVEYTSPVPVNGETVFFIPSERFVHFLDGLKQSVEAGELDKELEAAADGSTSTTTASGKPDGRKTRAPMTEEQKAERNRKMKERGTAGQGGRRKKS